MQMQNDLIAKAMLAMGWNPDSEIPMANEENVCIHEELERLVEEKAQLQEALHQTEERCEKLQQHSKNAEVSLNQNLKLLHAFTSEVHTESHLFKVAEREHSKLKELIRNLGKEQDTYHKYVESTELELCKRKRSIDDRTNRIKSAKTALIEWRELMEDGNKGYQLIERYYQDDQIKAREQDQRRQCLQRQIDKYRSELVELYDEQKTLEQNLECLATLYRSAHAERRQMVETWKAAVQQMTQREHDIQHGEIEMVRFRHMAQQKDGDRKRYDEKLNMIIDNNREVEAAIEELNANTSDLKEQIQRLMDVIILKEQEVELIQKDLQNLSNHVQQQRAGNRLNAIEKSEKTNELESFGEVIKKLEERLAAIKDKNMNANQRLQMLEDMNIAEANAQQQVTKETTRINGLLFRAQQQAVKLKDELKVLEINNSGVRVTITAIKKNVHNKEKELHRMTEVHYELGFKCLDHERRIIKVRGGVLDPQQELENMELLVQLEEQHTKTMKRLTITEAHNKKLDDGMRTLTMVYNRDMGELELMHFKIKEAQVYCEGGLKRIKSETHCNQVLIVELSIMKMRANEFENEIAKCENSTYNLEKHRMQLNRTIKVRMIEIKSQMDVLHLKRKHLSEEKSTLRADVAERNKHIDAMRARFDLTSKLLGTNEDGTLVTATQLKVETAQEKQMLLDEGNVLNEKVLKAEEEIKAMENTLLLMNSSNDAYRTSLRKPEDGDEATTEFKNLQSNYCKALSRLKTLRNQLLQMDQENEKLSKQKEDLENKLEIEIRKRLDNNEVLTKLQKELLDQKVKMQRAEREMKMALKGLKQRAISADFIALYERDLDLRELEYRNSNALNQLGDMADNDDERGPKIVRLLAQKGLKMPHQLQKTRSFASWRSEVSEMSYSSSKDFLNTTSSRSSISDGSHLRIQQSSTRVSVVSLDFPETH